MSADGVEGAFAKEVRDGLWAAFDSSERLERCTRQDASALGLVVERIVAARVQQAEAERDEALDRYAEREQRWHWTLIRESNAEGRAIRAEAERDVLRGRLGAVEELADRADERMDVDRRLVTTAAIRAALDGPA